MKIERIKNMEAEQQPVMYTTLEEALQAKGERTKRILNKLNPEARARMTNQAKQGREASLADNEQV